MAVRTWGVHIVGQTGFKMGALMPPAEAERRYQAETTKIAQAFFHAIAEKRYLRPSFLSLMIFRIQQISWQKAVDRETLDYGYWTDQGWFDADSTFYIEHQAHPVKVALARLTGTVLAPFVT
jgi:hypothetical protein